MWRHLPNVLTFFRIAMIPVVAICLLKNSMIAVVFFALACLTDYLDGYIARTFSYTSRLGAFLDPVADKLLVASTLLLLAGLGRISLYGLVPAVIILCREILISGLREFLSAHQVFLPVTKLGKWKTAVQMLSLICLLINYQTTYVVGEVLLWCASLLATISAIQYFKSSNYYF